MKHLRRFAAALLALCLLFPFAACRRIAVVSLPKNLVADYEKQQTPALTEAEQTRREKILSDYGWSLYRELLATAEPGQNQLFSPLSLEFALCMVANGAVGETRAEIERAVGLSVSEMNETLRGILSRVEKCKSGTVVLANSIWFKEDDTFSVSPDFLQTVANYYDAQAYLEPLDDTTCDRLNAWVKEYTRGMIPKLLDHIGPDMVMLLVNVLTFESEWETPYEKSQIDAGRTFRNSDGSEANVTMLQSTENRYVKGCGFVGFIKAYDVPYNILFLLPEDETADVRTAMAALSGEDVRELTANPIRGAKAHAEIPEFTYDVSYDLVDAVASTGVALAFDDENADFTGLGKSPYTVYIDLILQKTHIEVDRNGTKAAAATVIGMKNATAMPSDIYDVILDRPFGYVIYDAETDTPLFLGAVTTLGK